MGKLKKKGESGEAANFISRTRAVRKLQLSLADFRRLCILKGIYPREPKNKKKVSGGSSALTTYYFIKDIQYLAHEPLLDKFREMKSFMRKIRRAQGKDQKDAVSRLEKRIPKAKLDHIVRERYPTFVDALRDLDDCLCMLCLFASFPQTDVIQAKIVETCKKLSDEFLAYVSEKKCLKKVFLSIKGIYYQAEVQGQEITWVAPYKFSNATVPTDVDFRVMNTFLMFYTTLQQFVNFKLYNDADLVYPPTLESGDFEATVLNYHLKYKHEQEEPQETRTTKAQRKQVKKTHARLSAALSAVKASMMDTDDDVPQEKAAGNKTTASTEVDEFPEPASGDEEDEDGDIDVLPAPRDMTEEDKIKGLFKNCVFFLSREVPQDSLAFVIKAFSGQVSWTRADGRHVEYGPDSTNITHYIIDRPSISNRVEGRRYLQPQWVYDCINSQKLLPTAEYTIGATLPPHLSPFAARGPDEYVPGQDVEEDDDEDVELDEEPDEDDGAITEDEEEKTKKEVKQAVKRQKRKAVEEVEQTTDEKELAKMMMTRKNRVLYNKMMHGKAKKQAKVDKLKAKKKELLKKQKKEASS